MKNSLIVIALIVSLLGNVALAFGLLSRSPSIDPAEGEFAEAGGGIEPSRKTEPITHWFDVESDDPRKLAENLRRIGCPERLVRNAVVADIDRALLPRYQELRSVEEFWLTADAMRAINLEREFQFIALSDERDQMILEIAGIDPRFAPSKEWDGAKAGAVMAYYFHSLAPEEAVRVWELYRHADRNGGRSRVYDEFLPEEEALASKRAEYSRYRSALDESMSKRQRLAFDLQSYGMDQFDVWKEEAQFGRKLTTEERTDMLEILMPPDFPGLRFGLPLESQHDEALRAERHATMVDRFGEEMVNHFRDFESRKYLPQNAVFRKKSE